MVHSIVLQTAFQRGEYVGKAIFYLALAGLGIYILWRMNKKKKG
jgi:hypothetical protein